MKQGKEINLLDTIIQKDRKRVESCLKTLLPHLKKNSHALVGGIAIRYHLTNAGINYEKRVLNDLDITVYKPNVVSPRFQMIS